MLEEFSRDAFNTDSSVERDERCLALGMRLTEMFLQTPGSHTSSLRLIAQLRALGHDLWSFDESHEWEVWGPNYLGDSSSGIIVTFDYGKGVSVEWSK